MGKGKKPVLITKMDFNKITAVECLVNLPSIYILIPDRHHSVIGKLKDSKLAKTTSLLIELCTSLIQLRKYLTCNNQNKFHFFFLLFASLKSKKAEQCYCKYQHHW